MSKNIQLYLGDSKEVLKQLANDSVDLLLCDPPYQLDSIRERFGKEDSAPAKFGKDGAFQRASKGFMGKKWDVLPPIEVWEECLRVLKPGAFAFVMTTPRQDSLCQILMDLSQAGFCMGFSSIYWSYATGFPKASNISKMVDKRLGIKMPIGKRFTTAGKGNEKMGDPTPIGKERDKMRHKATSSQAKKLDGSYAGAQFKPAVEIIIVAMKPLSEKSYIDQALKNSKGITWLDDARIPYESEDDKFQATPQGKCTSKDKHTGAEPDAGNDENRTNFKRPEQKGRFPANLICSDDVLNDGKIMGGKSGKIPHSYDKKYKETLYTANQNKSNSPSSYGDKGSYSRYFDLDKWWIERVKKLPLEVQKVLGDKKWETKIVEEENGLKKKNLLANTVEKNSLITNQIEQESINSVPNNVQQNLDLKDQNQNAKFAGKKSNYTEINIAQKLVQIKQDTETSLDRLEKELLTPTMLKSFIQKNQKDVKYAINLLKYWRDIIQTLISQQKLYGYVNLAIIEQMQQEINEDPVWKNFDKLPEGIKKTFPFLIVCKASKREKNKGCENLESKKGGSMEANVSEKMQLGGASLKGEHKAIQKTKNNHPTVKPIKLMSYLITLGSREGEVVLDPFAGSCTTGIACKLLNRKFIGIEMSKEYLDIGMARIKGWERNEK